MTMRKKITTMIRMIRMMMRVTIVKIVNRRIWMRNYSLSLRRSRRT